MDKTKTDDTKKLVRKRIGVAIYFFFNGFIIANWASRLPELQEFYSINNSKLGLLLLIAAFGALIAMPISGKLSAAIGSNRITQVTGFAFCIILSFLTIDKDLHLAALIFFAYGVFNGSLNVAMNIQAVNVEKLIKKSIMSSFHAIFSIGMALGAASGAIFAKFNFTLSVHLQIISVFCFALALLASFNLIEYRVGANTGRAKMPKSFRRNLLLILPFGIIGFCAMTGENVMTDWSAIYMHKVMDFSEATSALALWVYAMAMTTGRVFGDYTITKLGRRDTMKINGVLTIIGILVIIVPTFQVLPFLGFFLIGLGLANVVPIIFSMSGNIEGIDSNSGVAIATTISYTGFFVGPPAIGFLGDLYGLRMAFTFALILFVIMIVFTLFFFKNSKRTVIAKK